MVNSDHKINDGGILIGHYSQKEAKRELCSLQMHTQQNLDPVKEPTDNPITQMAFVVFLTYLDRWQLQRGKLQTLNMQTAAALEPLIAAAVRS